MKELIEIYSDLLDKHFEKGKCKERGQALVLVAELNIAFKELIKKKMLSETEWDGFLRRYFCVEERYIRKIFDTVKLAKAIHTEQMRRLK